MWSAAPNVSAPGDAPTIPDFTQPSSPAAPPPTMPAYVPRAYAPPPSMPPAALAPVRRISALERVGNKLAQTVALVSDLAVAILLLRIALIFLAANGGAPFARIIALLSGPLVAPFNDLFPPVLLLQGQIDLAAVVAVLAYMLVARILEGLVRLVTRW